MSRNPHYIKMINSNKWKLLRAKKLQSNPVCEVCEANNRSTLATEDITPSRLSPCRMNSE